MDEIVVAIDIGTSKVCALIGKISGANQLDILGKGMDICSGVKKGIIVDIESTANSIRNSIKQAEAASNLKAYSAYANIIGTHVSVINDRSAVNISSANHEITGNDVDKALAAFRSADINEDRQIIDIIPQQFVIDGYDEILDPVGMMGTRLEVDAYVVAGKITSVQNIVKSMEKAGLRVDGLIVEALAGGENLLTLEEKEIGAVLIDIGGGVTDISVFKNKKLIFNDSIPVGGDHITNDISIGLKISYSEAEKIKRQYELALTSLIKNDQEISVVDINDDRKKTLKVSEVVEIIEARVYEIFSLARELLANVHIEVNGLSGVILTGRGISYVDGSTQLANEVFDMPVRVVSYKHAGASSAEFLSATGMVKYILNIRKGTNLGSEIKVLKQNDRVKKSGFSFAGIAKFFGRFF